MVPARASRDAGFACVAGTVVKEREEVPHRGERNPNMAEMIQLAGNAAMMIIALVAITACALAPIAMEQIEGIDQA